MIDVVETTDLESTPSIEEDSIEECRATGCSSEAVWEWILEKRNCGCSQKSRSVFCDPCNRTAMVTVTLDGETRCSKHLVPFHVNGPWRIKG